MRWAVVWQSLDYLLEGALWTLVIAVGVLAIGTALGLVFGLLRLVKTPLVAAPVRAYVEVARGTPLIMQMFFIYYGLPPALGVEIPPYVAVVLAMTVFASGNSAEIVRGAIESLPAGQFEAARSGGLGYLQTMRYVILPQALRRMLPPQMGLFTTLIKDTSLAAILGVFELTTAAQRTIERTLASFELYLFAAAVYFVICYPLSVYTRGVERRQVV